MNCPKCKNHDTRIIERRNFEEVARRRRECASCKHRFTTYEVMKEEYKKPKKKMVEIKKKDPMPDKAKTKEEKKRAEYFGKFGKTKVNI